MKNVQQVSGSGASFETNEYYALFSPHVGAAYQFSPKLVIRGAWGLFYVPLGQNMWGGIPYEDCFNCFGSNTSKPGPSNVVPSFQWDQDAYPGVAIQAAKNANANDFGWGQAYATPNSLNLGRTQNWNLGFEYGLNTNTVLDVRYVGNVGYDLHDGGLYPENFPTWSQYYPLLMSGHAGDSISTQSEAVAAGVPWYPFLPAMAGGCGSYSAESAISPQPQTDACWGSSLRVAGNPRGNSGYNGVVAEIKKRAGNGLSMDLSYTMSKAVGNVTVPACPQFRPFICAGGAVPMTLPSLVPEDDSIMFLPR